VAERVVIDRLGSRGDGVAETAERATYIPRALPGETVLIERDRSRGRLIGVETPSLARVEAFCPYFASCGGCAAQHMGATLYADWKRGTVAGALRQADIDAPLEALVDAHGEGRRRITLHARVRDGETRVGYMAARSHDLISITHCPITVPALTRAPAVARALAESLARARKPLDIQITATEGGLDCDVRGHGPAAERERQALIEAASAQDLARVSLHGDVLVERRAPHVTMDRASVVPPPGAFLQATLQLDDPRLQLLDAPPLPVQGLEQAVERLPDHVAHLLFHSLSLRVAACLLQRSVSYVKQCTTVPGLLQA